jgi:parallel beta-helix repeat protein
MTKILTSLHKSSALYTCITLRHSRLLAGMVFSIAGIAAAQDALALPQGASVVSGQVTISQPTSTSQIISQGTDKAIINWQSFNILNGESTQIVQPSASSVQLDRVTGGDPTRILGSLSSNGKVWLVNSNGVFFGKEATVNTGALIVSTADISDTNFKKGKAIFDIAGNPNAKIVNKGKITAAQGGLVALVAPRVVNSGVITAQGGTVAIGAGKTFAIDMYGDGLYSFAVDSPSTSASKDKNGNAVAAITNSGMISAPGGTVYLTARAAKEVVDKAINTTGIIEATASHNEGGVIVLDGGEGSVNVAGKLDVSGKQAGQTGGTVHVLGDAITLASTANIDASGAAGGGKVRIGGDAHGKGTLAHAKSVKVDKGSSINVNATDKGNGGSVVVWSDKQTIFNGSILGHGGINGGAGGFAEVSSAGELGFNGFAGLSAPHGGNGTLLLDPTNIIVENGVDQTDANGNTFVSNTSIATTLNGGTNVVETATNDIDVVSDIIWSSSANLTFNAGHDFNLAGLVASDFVSADHTLGTINISAGNNAVIGGNFSIPSPTGCVFCLVGVGSSGQLSTNSGNVTIGAGNSVQLTNPLGTASSITGGNDVTFNTNDMSLTGGSSVSAGNTLNVNNTGVFDSDTASVLLGNSLFLNQQLPGSIQNAIDAINPVSGQSTLTLADGMWDQLVSIKDRNNFTLTGTSQAHTFIQPTSVAGAPSIVNGPGGDSYAPIVLVQNGNNINISNLTIDGSQVVGNKLRSGLIFANAGGVVHNITITQGGTYGLLGIASSLFGDTAQLLNASGLTVSGNDYAGVSVIGDNIMFNLSNSLVNGSGGVVSLEFANGSSGSASNNVLTSGSDGVVVLRGAHDLTISGGAITGGGAGTYGIYDDSQNASVPGASHIKIKDVNISNVGTGIYANHDSEWSITGNTITSADATGSGIRLRHLLHAAVGDGDATDANANTINGFNIGVNVESDSASVAVWGNKINNSNYAGISVSSSNNGTVANNILSDMNTDGIDVSNANNFAVYGNTINSANPANTGNGILLDTVTNSKITSNQITDFDTGIALTNNSDNVQLVSNTVTNAGTGILVDGSSNNSVRDNTLNSIENYGINVHNSNNVYLLGNSAQAATDGAGTGIALNNVTNSHVGDGNPFSANANIAQNFATGFAILNHSDFDDVSGNISFFAGSAGIRLQNSYSTSIENNLLLFNVNDGVDVNNASNLTVANNMISSLSGGGTGILFDSVADSLIGDNDVSFFATGVNIIDNSVNINVDHNTFSDSTIAAISTGDSTNLNITNNDVTSTITGDGITASSGDTIKIYGNTLNGANSGAGIRLHNVTDSGIGDGNAADANTNSVSGFATGINVSDGSVNIFVGGNNVNGSSIAGISIDDSHHVTVANNLITHMLGDGIDGSNGSSLTIVGNTMTSDNGVGVGIELNNVTDTNAGDGNTADTNANAINNFATGISVLGGSDNVAVSGNTIDASSVNGVKVVGSNDIRVSNNLLTNVSGNGVSGFDTNALNINGNTMTSVSGTGTGITLDHVTDSNVGTGGGNSIDGFAIGVSVSDGSGNVFVSNNQIQNSTVAGIAVDNSDLITLANNTITNATGDGIDASTTTNLGITGNTITGTGTSGISLSNVTGATLGDGDATDVNANTVNGFTNGIALSNDSSNVQIIGNNINSSTDNGILIDTATNVLVANNVLTDMLSNGVTANNASLIDVTGNSITALIGNGVNGIEFNNVSNSIIGGGLVGDANSNTVSGFNTSAVLIGSSNIGVLGNTFDSSIVAGIFADSTNDSTFANNLFTNTAGDGIDIQNNSNQIAITANNLTSSSGFATSISVDGSSNITIGDGTAAGSNTVSGFDTGISVTGGSDTISIANNNIDNTATAGVSIDSSTNVEINGNSFTNVFGNGINANNVGGLTITGNNVDISSGVIGINVNGSNGAQFASNVVTGAGSSIGVFVSNSDNVTFSSDSFTSNDVGLQISNAQNTSIDGVTFTDNNTGFFAQNGSGDALVNNTTFTGGTVGVRLSDSGTSMSFVGNTNNFSNMPGYFVLANGAMFGQVLDASQQIFDGIRASDFTFAQWSDAEGRTIDFHTDTTLGTVFYKNFPNQTPNINFGSIINQALLNPEPLFLQSIFSYAGHTLTAPVTELAYNFSVPDINLSLLTSGATPAGTLPIGSSTPDQLANLAPAAGGTAGNGTEPVSDDPKQLAKLAPAAGGSSSPEDLANLAPAAGGSTPQQLAALAPAAGGSPSCGNGFLGGGFSTSYSSVTCSVNVRK